MLTLAGILHRQVRSRAGKSPKPLGAAQRFYGEIHCAVHSSTSRGHRLFSHMGLLFFSRYSFFRVQRWPNGKQAGGVPYRTTHLFWFLSFVSISRGSSEFTAFISKNPSAIVQAAHSDNAPTSHTASRAFFSSNDATTERRILDLSSKLYMIRCLHSNMSMFGLPA